MIKIKKLASNKTRFLLNFENLRNFFYTTANSFVFALQCIQRKNVTIEIEDERETP